MSWIVPHLNRSIRSQFHLIEATLHNVLYSETFERLNVGIAFLGRHQNILVENKKARSIFRDEDPITVRKGKLTAISGEHADKLERFIFDAVTRTGNLGGSVLLVGSGVKKISVMITPTPDDLRDATGAEAIVYLSPLNETNKWDLTQHLKTMYGLTGSESRIGNLLVKGLSTRQIADELHLTYETARSVIKHIFAKTGAHRRTEFVAQVNQAIPFVRISR